jgi:CopG family nickel-responsive transcriptional regulator
MAKKTRVSLSIPTDLLEDFDGLSKSLGHPNRSKAVGEAMRAFLSARKWDLAKKGTIPGVILVTYDHHSRGLNRALTELQHDFPDVISATMHIHLSKHTCLEVIAFRGEAERIRCLARVLQFQKGVLDLKLITSHS